jgi:hypothetical protein
MAILDGLTFEQWMAQVDQELMAIAGMDHMCIADRDWWNAWNDGTPSDEAAEEALISEGFPI